MWVLEVGVLLVLKAMSSTILPFAFVNRKVCKIGSQVINSFQSLRFGYCHADLKFNRKHTTTCPRAILGFKKTP